MRRNATHSGLFLIGLITVAGTTPAAISVYLAPEQLAARAPLVVEGTVIDTRSGLDPHDGSLNTYITLRLSAVHRGPQELTELVIREPGGRWGDLANVLDAVPVYTAGERVLAFLEPASDGALRTVGMFFGKFRLRHERVRGPLTAERDLEGQGLILGRAATSETLTRNDLIAVTATVPFREIASRTRPGRRAARSDTTQPTPVWTAVPPEWNRLSFEPDAAAVPAPPREGLGDNSSGPVDLALRAVRGFNPEFVPLSQTNPARWTQSDSGTPLSINIEPAGNPLNDAAAAVIEIGRALAAWTAVPEARLELTLGDTNYDYTGQNGSPASNYSGINVVLFNDPYDDISDPSGCGGVLAIGGYWRSGSSGTPVNNVTFHPALQLYVIFNNNFECYLGDPDNLAEVATHEIGHGIGFGHSTVSDAIMRSSAYGNRGPRLGDDDMDAAHCHYPHQLTLVSPNGGETLITGTLETIDWAVSTEAGADPGTVDLEYSTDGGTAWKTVVDDTPNDGSFGWSVPNDPSVDVRLRVVRHARTGALPAPYPATSCSNDASNGAVTISAAVAVAGRVGNGLLVDKVGGGQIRADWAPSCSGDADDYVIYEGNLNALRSGSWDHVPVTCNAGTDLFEQFAPAAGTSYYLVAPRAGTAEGELGVGSAGQPRPESIAACAVRESSGC